MMRIEDFELAGIRNVDGLVGKNFFFRTVTYHMVGRVAGYFELADGTTFLRLENSSWIAESGRFMQTIQNGELREVEPVSPSFISLSTVTDFFPWVHDLPTEQR